MHKFMQLWGYQLQVHINININKLPSSSTTHATTHAVCSNEKHCARVPSFVHARGRSEHISNHDQSDSGTSPLQRARFVRPNCDHHRSPTGNYPSSPEIPWQWPRTATPLLFGKSSDAEVNAHLTPRSRGARCCRSCHSRKTRQDCIREVQHEERIEGPTRAADATHAPSALSVSRDCLKRRRPLRLPRSCIPVPVQVRLR